MAAAQVVAISLALSPPHICTPAGPRAAICPAACGSILTRVVLRSLQASRPRRDDAGAGGRGGHRLGRAGGHALAPPRRLCAVPHRELHHADPTRPPASLPVSGEGGLLSLSQGIGNLWGRGGCRGSAGTVAASSCGRGAPLALGNWLRTCRVLRQHQGRQGPARQPLLPACSIKQWGHSDRFGHTTPLECRHAAS